jgi:bacteriocin biosynthesis cyclodehydratase domain-containing protein
MQLTEKAKTQELTAYRIRLTTCFIRIDKETGFVIGSKAIEQVRGALYLDILEHCAVAPLNTFALTELLKKDHAGAYVWHATDLLKERTYIEASATVTDYVKNDSFKLEPDILWSSCSENEIPVISFVDDLDSDKARSEYMQAQQQNRNWLPIVWTGPTPSVGPVFTLNGPCLECLNFRLRENRSLITWLKNHVHPKEIYPKWITRETLSEYQEKVCAFASWTPHGSLQNKLVSLVAQKNPEHHVVIKRPECSKCGDQLLFSKKMLAPVHLVAGDQCGDYTYGFRCKSPDDTWNDLKHHISPITGIVNQIDPLENTDCTIFPVYRSGFSVSPGKHIPEWNAFHMTVFGKGRTVIASKVSALCEGIERASARYRGDEPIHCGSIKEMGASAIAPHSIQHFSKEQLQKCYVTPALGPVPREVQNNESLDWLPGWSLRFNERRFIPADAVLLNRPIAADMRVAVFESNGLSAGNTLEEATLQGLLEIIERDAVAIWWFNRLQRPAFKLDLLKDDDWFQHTLSNLKKEKWDVHFLDLTLDTHIPVVAAIGKTEQGWLYGFGCHFSPQLAAVRALTELVQVKPIMKPVSPPEDWSNVDYLYPHAGAKIIEPYSLNSSFLNNTTTLIQHAVQRLADIGSDTIIINCTRPDINVPVAKISVPGFRAFRPRFAPGRLYDLPLELGLMQESKSQLEMTPFWLTM